MSLDDWVSNGWLTRHEATPTEVRGAMAAAAADIADAKKDVSPGWRFAIAYNAALRLATAVLAAAGYRATRDQKHFRTIAALPQVLGAEAADLADFLDRCRTKRHDVTYESTSAVSDDEADELIKGAEELEALVRRWLGSRIATPGASRPRPDRRG